MKNKPTLTLGTFKKSNEVIKLSKDVTARLQELTTKPMKNVANISPTTFIQDKAKDSQDNKKITSLAKEQISNKSKTKGFRLLSKEDYQVVLNYMQKYYPKCFPDNASPLPLAIGIREQLFAIEDTPFTKTKIRKFLTIYTRTYQYLNNIVVGNDRFNFDGTPATKIPKEEIYIFKPKTDNKKSNQQTKQKKIAQSVSSTTNADIEATT